MEHTIRAMSSSGASAHVNTSSNFEIVLPWFALCTLIEAFREQGPVSDEV